MARGLKLGRIIIWLVILPLILGMLGKWLLFTPPKYVHLPFDEIEQIGSEIKLSAKPDRYFHAGTLTIEVSLESGQQPTLIDQDPMDIFMLLVENDDTPILPESFKETVRDEYQVKGVLTFKVPSQPDFFKLTLFLTDEDEYDFSWRRTP